MSRAHILLVEDDQSLVELLTWNLEREDFEVEHTADGEEALLLARESPPDLVLLDWMIEGLSGIEVCRRLRRIPDTANVPIIMLTARGEEEDRVRGLETGADDYVTKPFGINELLARVRANLRRVPQGQESPGGLIAEGDFRVDLDAHVAYVRDRELKLTPKEFDLLAYLARNPRKVVTHRKLLTAIWGPNSTEQPEYLRVFIGQLRKKIEDKGSQSYILTEPWVGYRFEPEGVGQDT